MAYAIISLPTQLRRTDVNPAAAFVAIACCNGLSLALCITILDAWQRRESRQWAAVGASFVDLFDIPSKITDLTGRHVAAIALAVLAALYYYAGVKALVNPKAFIRTDQDRRELASATLLAGDSDKADVWLAGVKENNPHSFRLWAWLNLTRGRFDQAADSAYRALRAGGDDDTEDNVASLLGELFADSVGANTVPNTTRESFCVYLIKSHSSDGIVATYVNSIVLLSDDTREMATRLCAQASEALRPITRALLLSAGGDTHEARAVLRRALPGSELEEFLRLTYERIFWFAEMNSLIFAEGNSASWEEADQQLCADCDNWLTVVLPTVEGLARAVVTTAERTVVTINLLNLQGLFRLMLDFDDLPWPDVAGTSHKVECMRQIARDVAPSTAIFLRFQTLVRDFQGE